MKTLVLIEMNNLVVLNELFKYKMFTFDTFVYYLTILIIYL